jgi:hypothetical protein
LATDKGNVRVEQCGANLCGYGEKSGEKSKELVLIDMKPSSDNSKWTGRIDDPTSGSNYDSTITMEGPDQLKVQGCMIGGMFCGNTTWKRVQLIFRSSRRQSAKILFHLESASAGYRMKQSVSATPNSAWTLFRWWSARNI